MNMYVTIYPSMYVTIPPLFLDELLLPVVGAVLGHILLPFHHRLIEGDLLQDMSIYSSQGASIINPSLQ